MAATVGTKLAAMRKDCEDIVSELNKLQAYRSATAVQNLLTQIANTEERIKQDAVANPSVEG